MYLYQASAKDIHVYCIRTHAVKPSWRFHPPIQIMVQSRELRFIDTAGLPSSFEQFVAEWCYCQLHLH